MNKRKLGILISCAPRSPRFKHGIELAKAALNTGVDVYLYLLYDAVVSVDFDEVQQLKKNGAKLYVCAFGANRRNIKLSDSAIFSGLGSLSDIINYTDKFIAFNR
ncbi:MAG: DsrE family protein [Verrucomicrobiia bacterium]